MKRSLSMVVTCLVALAAIPFAGSGVVAQGGPPLLGSPVDYVGDDGVLLGTVTVNSVVDPYTEVREGYEAGPGTKLVLVEVTFEGSEDAGFDVTPSDILGHDTAGGLWSDSLSGVPEDHPVPELSSQTLGPGDRVSGYVGYTIPDDLSIDDVFFAPEQGVLLTVADMIPGVAPAIGDPLVVDGTDEGLQVTATVKSVDDPYKAFDKDRPPVDGARFVMATVSFDNTGTGPFGIETNSVLVRDQQGNLWGRASIVPAKKPKVSELESVDLARGNRITARVGYQVPKGTTLEGVWFQAEGRLVQLADLDGSAGPVAGGCDELRAWWAEVEPLMQRLFALPYFAAETPAMDLAASQAALAELESIGAAHLAISVPSGLVEAHRRFLAGFLLYEESARTQVAAQEAEDPSLIGRSGEAFEAAQLVMGDAVASLTPLGFDDCISG